MQRRDFLKSVLAAGGTIFIGARPTMARAHAHPTPLMPKVNLDVFTQSGTILVRVPLTFSPASKGCIRLKAPSSSMAIATGDARYFQLTSDGETVYQGTCGDIHSGELRFGSSVVAGGTVAIHSFQINGHSGEIDALTR